MIVVVPSNLLRRENECQMKFPCAPAIDPAAPARPVRSPKGHDKTKAGRSRNGIPDLPRCTREKQNAGSSLRDAAYRRSCRDRHGIDAVATGASERGFRSVQNETRCMSQMEVRHSICRCPASPVTPLGDDRTAGSIMFVMRFPPLRSWTLREHAFPGRLFFLGRRRPLFGKTPATLPRIHAGMCRFAVLRPVCRSARAAAAGMAAAAASFLSPGRPGTGRLRN